MLVVSHEAVRQWAASPAGPRALHPAREIRDRSALISTSPTAGGCSAPGAARPTLGAAEKQFFTNETSGGCVGRASSALWQRPRLGHGLFWCPSKSMHFDHPTGSAAPLLVSVVLAMLVALGSPFAAAQPVDVSAPGAPGATVDELLDMGRRLNPGLAEAALNAEAAVARIGTAGRFPDPTFRTELWDVRAARDTALPQAPGQVKYTVEQTVPLWGKLDLQRKIARAEAGSASEQRRAVETALLARIKTVFAGSWGTQETIRITRELLGSVSAIARVAESRYGQGRGNQQDVVTAEVERGRLQADLARLDGEQRNLDRADERIAEPAGRCTARHRRRHSGRCRMRRRCRWLSCWNVLRREQPATRLGCRRRSPPRNGTRSWCGGTGIRIRPSASPCSTRTAAMVGSSAATRR